MGVACQLLGNESPRCCWSKWGSSPHFLWMQRRAQAAWACSSVSVGLPQWGGARHAADVTAGRLPPPPPTGLIIFGLVRHSGSRPGSRTGGRGCIICSLGSFFKYLGTLLKICSLGAEGSVMYFINYFCHCDFGLFAGEWPKIGAMMIKKGNRSILECPSSCPFIWVNQRLIP